MIQQFNEQNDISMYNMVQFTLPTLLETNQLLSRLVAEQERGNALQEQILEELKKEKKGVKRKVSSVSSPTNSISNCSTTESEKKKCKKNATCSDDELCIRYEGSSNHSIIIRKELLKGPVLGAAISGNFLQESTFILPSDSIKLSNISKTMKQLKKFFHGEQLDKINEETKTDLFNLADFLALPELKLELLKIKIAETPVQKKNNLSLLYTIVNQVSKQLPGILLDLDHDEILQGLKSFHDFIATGTRSINFVVACFHVLFQYADVESIQKIGVIFVPKGVYGPSPHFAQTLVNTLDEMKHRLIKIWLEDEFQSDDKEMKIRLVNQSIVNPHLKVAITGN